MKHLNLRNTLIALALTGAAATSFAATTSTLDLTVGGTISPAPCTLDFGAGNTVDFGTTKASALSKTAYYDLGTKTTSANITCSAAIKVAFKTIDNRAATVINDSTMATLISGTDAFQLFGLGTAGSANIGAYAIRFTDAATFDGKKTGNNMYTSGTATGSSTWIATPGFISPSGYSYSAGTGTTPAAGKVMSYPLSIRAALNKSTALNLVNDINLDGSATFEMVYL
ncbi:DUF1120 domain-containing protein [Andreprevotia chitinilytica]|uniref:DUF1120 domain-containing protein n=1 Tax=Andreprevotia chitinilytica TaxID=396808 RepID=UPI000557533D|nr:DUF1120 domain-containing protein [Andreprevotia chitinilytica]